jgi:hypothetical protein
MEKPADVMNAIEKKTKTIVAKSGVIEAIANAVISDKPPVIIQ